MRALARFGRAAGFAVRGLGKAWQREAHLRFEVGVAVLAVVAAVVLGRGVTAVVLASALVLVVELLNTAVEAVVDLAAPGPDPRAALAKDVAAGAVLVASVAALAVGVAVFGPPLWAWWRGAVG